MDELDHHSIEMTQTDFAMTSAVKAIIDILLVSGLAQPRAFDARFESMSHAYAAQGDLKAAQLLEMLRAFANDPKRAAVRETRRKLRDEPPAGSA